MPPKKGIRSFKPKQRVLAKMPGYSPWPAFLVPDDQIPEDVLKAQPKKGKRYCVIFIPDGDYCWISDKGINNLSDEQLKASLADIPLDIKRKMKNLKGVVRGKSTPIKNAIAAADGLSYDDFLDHLSLAEAQEEVDDEEEEEDQDQEEEEEVEEGHNDDELDHSKQENDDEDEEEEEEEEVQDEEEDEEDEEDEEEEVDDYKNVAKPKSRKIKVKPKNSKSDDEADFGDISDESIETKKTSKNGKNLDRLGSNGNGKKRKIEDVDSSGTDLKSNKKKIQPGSRLSGKNNEDRPTKRERGTLITPTTEKPVLSEKEKQNQLWLCRVKLQKTLIQRNQPNTPKDTIGLKPPTADELLTARLILYRLLEFPIDKELLRKTKMHKVLKTIIKDKSLQYSDSFKLHDRCEEVLNKWHGPIEELRNEKVYEHKRNHSKDDLDSMTSNNHNNNNNNANDNGSKSSSSSSEINRKLVAQDDSEVSGLEQSISELDQPKNSELSTDDI